jgi:hypothetical protein
MTARGFPPLGEDWKRWANSFTAYMGRALSQLAFKYSGSVASEDGVLLWDAANGYPVVSKDGVWRQIPLADGYALLNQRCDNNSLLWLTRPTKSSLTQLWLVVVYH